MTGDGKGTNDLGTQPLDVLMTKHGLTNHALVAASAEQLSHKGVQRARKGRRLTSKAKTKILDALHNALPGKKFAHRDLFNY
jgi:fido (protein-threonine AMPylation protein)